MINSVFSLSISPYQEQQQQFVLPPVLQYHYQQQQQHPYLSYLVDHNDASFSLLQQYRQQEIEKAKLEMFIQQCEIEKAELEMFIQQCDQQLLFHSIMNDGMDDDYFDEEEDEDEDEDEDENEDNDSYVNEAGVDDEFEVEDEIEEEFERSHDDDDDDDDDNNKRRRESQPTRVVRRRSKRIRLYKQSSVKFKAGAAMTTDQVKLRLKELKLITAEQFASSDLNIRFAEESDWSARSKNELQQQVLHQCRYSIILEIVRCSGIEGHHIESRSSWAYPGNRMGNHCLNVLGKIVCSSVVDCFVIVMYN